MAAAIPREYLESASMVGPLGYVKERVASYKQAGVTYLQMGLSGSLEQRVKTVEQMRKIVDEI